MTEMNGRIVLKEIIFRTLKNGKMTILFPHKSNRNRPSRDTNTEDTDSNCYCLSRAKGTADVWITRGREKSYSKSSELETWFGRVDLFPIGGCIDLKFTVFLCVSTSFTFE